MKKALLCIAVILAFCISATGCNIDPNGAPDEWYIFGKDKSNTLRDYQIDYLKLSLDSTPDDLIISDYADMTPLFNMVNDLVLTKSYEGENLPDDFDLLCTVSFVHKEENRRKSYFFNLSTTGEICYKKGRLASESVIYVGNSTKILNEVNRLIELYN